MAAPDDDLTRDHVRDYVRAEVRAGLLSEQETYAEAVAAIAADLPEMDAGETATAWVQEARAELEADAAQWPAITDYERVQAALAELTTRGVAVLQACEDHWAAKRLLDERADDPRLRGVAWFLAADVWHAVDEGMLEVNLWHATTANVAEGDALLDEVLAVFAAHGLDAHFDEGRIEVSTHWQRRP